MVSDISSSVRVEIPFSPKGKIVKTYKTIGELKEIYKRLHFLKYIFKDPKDNKLKAINPPNKIPIVPHAYITVMGDMTDIRDFVEDATKDV